jgi:O-antigen/teichoic acid export membrane protein
MKDPPQSVGAQDIAVEQVAPSTPAASKLQLSRAARGGLWLGVGQTLGSVGSWVSTLVLARLLAPESFGIVGMAMVVIGFVSTIGDLGLGAALIQRKHIDDGHKDSAFWLSFGMGALIFAACAAASPLLALIYREPRVSGVVVLAACTLLLSPLFSTHVTLLRRDLRFSTVAKVEALRSLVSGAACVVAALGGLGYWAIPLGPLAGQLVAIPIYWAAEKFRPGFRGSLRHARELFRFSLFVAGGGAINYLSANVDYLVVGRALGPSALGVYTLAYQIITLPLVQISSLFNQVMYPVFSAAQDDLEQSGKAYLDISRSLALIGFPILGWIAVVAPDLLFVIYGEKWLGAVTPLRILCVAGAVKSVGTFVGTVYRSQGRSYVEFYWNIAWLIGISSAVLVGVRWGTLGVAVAISTLCVPGVLFTEWLACRYLNLPFRRFLHAMVVPLVGVSALLAAGFGLRSVLLSLPLSPLLAATVRLLALTVVCLLACTVALRVVEPRIYAQVRAFMAHFGRQK